MPEDIQTISVHVVNNETFWRGLELDLTREITDEIAARTPLILTNRKNADALLRGTIVSFRKAVLQEDLDDNTLEAAVVAVVEIELIELVDSLLVEHWLSDGWE